MNSKDDNFLTIEILDRLKSQGADISHIKENLAVLAANSQGVSEKLKQHDKQLEPIIKTYNFAQVAAKILATLGTLAALGIAGAKMAHADDNIPRIGIAPPDPPSVVHLERDNHRGCTGFVVAKNFIMTAAHCADPGVAIFPSGQKARYTVVAKGTSADADDVALLRAKTGDWKPFPIAQAEQFPQMSLFFSFRDADARPQAFPAALTETRIEVGSPNAIGKGFGQVYHGDSGGPILNGVGEVCGIVVMVQEDGSPVFWYVTLPVIKNMMKHISP